ncbi:MAG: ABC transporter permease [Pirellulaceae bacterium]|jgi:ribose transport system permease protein|nr:ABC transporter permease [Pirellulaceae bacterium]
MKRLFAAKAISDYGSLAVLLLLCTYYSFATISEQHPVTVSAGVQVADRILADHPRANVVIAVRDNRSDREFSDAIVRTIEAGGGAVVAVAAGDINEAPRVTKQTLRSAARGAERIHAIATHHVGTRWGPLKQDSLTALATDHPSLQNVRVYSPASYRWPSFLTWRNLTNIVQQNADIAIIAIGMTIVIITAGIDLSVGSLLAFSGVLTAISIQRMGGQDLGAFWILVGCLGGVAACAAVGAISGVMVTVARIPAFVVTLGMMMIIRGLSLKSAVSYQSAITGGTSATPEAIKIEATSFYWLGNESTLGVPNPILLMLALYVIAHVVMNHTTFGRYIYAVGGNPEAARLSGVPVTRVLILVYALCGAMAGLAGTLDSSRYEGGRPNAGELYELQAIAAVVVGGASLSGGEGKVFGTLIGALIIAVIGNGLHIAGVSGYDEMVVFGGLILAAVMLDQIKKRLT